MNIESFLEKNNLHFPTEIIFILTSAGDAGCHVSKTNSCHRHEAEIERIEQTPVLPDDEDAGPGYVEEDHRR